MGKLIGERSRPRVIRENDAGDDDCRDQLENGNADGGDGRKYRDACSSQLRLKSSKQFGEICCRLLPSQENLLADHRPLPNSVRRTRNGK